MCVERERESMNRMTLVSFNSNRMEIYISISSIKKKIKGFK